MSNWFQINVRLHETDILHIKHRRCTSALKVSKLKHLICFERDIADTSSFELEYEGTTLSDDLTLHDCKIVDENHMIDLKRVTNKSLVILSDTEQLALIKLHDAIQHHATSIQKFHEFQSDPIKSKNLLISDLNLKFRMLQASLFERKKKLEMQIHRMKGLKNLQLPDVSFELDRLRQCESECLDRLRKRRLDTIYEKKWKYQQGMEDDYSSTSTSTTTTNHAPSDDINTIVRVAFEEMKIGVQDNRHCSASSYSSRVVPKYVYPEVKVKEKVFWRALNQVLRIRHDEFMEYVPEKELLIAGFTRNTPLLDMRTIPRIVLDEIRKFYQGSKHFEYGSDFDNNGLLWYLGTNGDENMRWGNPHISGKVTVEASSLERDSRVEGFIDRQVRLQATRNEQNSWISVDLGHLEVKVSRYTMRHDNENGYFMRTWVFQGWNRKTGSWDDLDNRVNEHAINGPGESATFTCQQRSGVGGYYSKFRVYATGPTSNRDWYLCLAGFEMYGEVYGLE